MNNPEPEILWIDNDTSILYPYTMALEDAGYVVAIAPTVSAGAARLADPNLVLVILDVMIPVTEEEEQNEYPPERTDETHETGLAFYRKFRQALAERDIPVLAMTVRIDQGIADKFVAAGLPPECFVRKFEVRDADAFLGQIDRVIAKRAKRGG